MELHPHLSVHIAHRRSFRPAPRSSSGRSSLETIHRIVSSASPTAPNPLNYTRNGVVLACGAAGLKVAKVSRRKHQPNSIPGEYFLSPYFLGLLESAPYSFSI